MVKPPKVLPARRVTQWVAAAATVAIGVQLTLWVIPHIAGRWPDVSRPAGVEAFLPIDGTPALRHLVLTGVIDTVHPAGLAIFVGICLMSAVVAKSFCSHVCPVVLYLGVVTGFRIAGYWHTEITEAEYHRRLPEIASPIYTHPR